MALHDWTRVHAGIFHDFHHSWIDESKRALNKRLHGTEFYALAEQITSEWGPDVLALQKPAPAIEVASEPVVTRRTGGVALISKPPKLRFKITDEKRWYANKKMSVTIRHVSEHRVVAILEILSPGNKSSRDAIAAFIKKTHELLKAGVHVSLVDVFPPTRRDPHGIHPLVWSDEDDDTFEFDPAMPMTCASYVCSEARLAFVEPVGVGSKLPDLPVFLTCDKYVVLPLEKTYRAAFDAVPDFWQDELKRTLRA